MLSTNNAAFNGVMAVGAWVLYLVGGAVVAGVVLTGARHVYKDHAMLHRLLDNDARFLAWAEKTEKRLTATEAAHAAPSK